MTLAELNAWSGIVGTLVVMGMAFDMASPGTRRRRVLICYGGAIALSVTMVGRLVGLAVLS